MERTEFEKIFQETETGWTGDNAFQGLEIIKKYFPDKRVISGSGHDKIYSVDIDELIESGITEEETIRLRKLNWMIDNENECLACFV